MSATPPTADSQTVRFVLDGEVVQVASPPPTLTVLDYLRNELGRTGTKEGCAEGDCGACTVVLGELVPGERRIAWRAVNSCIRFLPTIDGKELVTVESLGRASRARDIKHDAFGGTEGSLSLEPSRLGGAHPVQDAHPVQQAMVDCHASQCGFCTPGFVMSLLALYLAQPSSEREQVVEALSGNLCRCTGYRPIIEAGCRMSAYPVPSRWSREDAQSSERIDALASIRRGPRDPSLSYGGDGGDARAGGNVGFRAPRTVDELASALLSEPDALILAGGTDVGLWVTKHLRDLPTLIYIGDVAELNHITRIDGTLRIGAAVPLSAAWPALVEAHPQLAEQARRFASPPVQNSGTLCGNVANGSPVGDSIPALIALGAHIELRKGARTRSLPLEQFYLGYQKKDLAPGEFVTAVTLPPADPALLFASYKVAKRFEQDISAVCTAFAVTTRDNVVVDARLAFGGMAAIPKRAESAEAELIGRPWTLETCEAAIRALSEDFDPLTDLRASKSYRLQAAGNLLKRFYLQHSDEPAPFSVMGIEPVPDQRSQEGPPT
jgi:xanthine dehydrogenase small subunit